MEVRMHRVIYIMGRQGSGNHCIDIFSYINGHTYAYIAIMQLHAVASTLQCSI